MRVCLARGLGCKTWNLRAAKFRGLPLACEEDLEFRLGLRRAVWKRRRLREGGCVEKRRDVASMCGFCCLSCDFFEVSTLVGKIGAF